MFLTRDVIEFNFYIKPLICLEFILVYIVKYGCDLVIFLIAISHSILFPYCYELNCVFLERC